MRAKNELVATVIVFTAATLLAPRSFAYVVNKTWCSADNLGIRQIQDTFTARGIDPGAAFAELAVAAAWWSEVPSGAGMRFQTPVVVNEPYSHGDGDPGPVYARCVEEGANIGLFANTHVAYGWDGWNCDPFSTYIDSWNMYITSNLWGYEMCSQASQWGLTRQDFVNGKQMLYRVFAHELGHVYGLGHSADFGSLMSGDNAPNQARINVDDVAGVINGLSSGTTDHQPIRTVSAHYSSPYTGLQFGTVKTVSPEKDSLQGPAIAGDPAYAYTGRDYALAWVDRYWQINVSTAKEGSSDTLTILSSNPTGEFTYSPVGVAVSPYGDIGVAFSGQDYYRTVNFMVSQDGGVSWTKTTFWGGSAMGGVTTTYDNNAGHWVISWVFDSYDNDPNATMIATVVSDDASGSTWPMSGGVYSPGGVDVAMETLRPAIACGSAASARCVLLYSDFTSPVKGLAKLALGAWGREPPTSNPQGVDWAVTYNNPNLVYVPPSSGGRPGTFFALWEQFSVGPTPLTYARLGENEVDVAAFHDWGSGPGSYPSRTGVSGAWNYRTNQLRFVWRAN